MVQVVLVAHGAADEEGRLRAPVKLIIDKLGGLQEDFAAAVCCCLCRCCLCGCCRNFHSGLYPHAPTAAVRGPRGRALLFASCVLVARMTHAACGSAACLLTDGSGTACDSRSAGCVRKHSEVCLGQISVAREAL
jgi:hypothetical protein